MIVLGRIVAPYGVKGWVKIHPFGDDPLAWRRMPQWWLSPKDNAAESEWQPRALKGLRAHGGGFVAALEGVEDRNAAEALDGFYFAAPREALPAPDKDEYYWGDLVGLRVLNRESVPLGTVSGLISTGVHDVLQLQDGEEERLIPFVAAYVDEVDMATGVIRVDWQADW